MKAGCAPAEGKITYFVNAVFHCPTLAECYKAAAFNGLNRRTELSICLVLICRGSWDSQAPIHHAFQTFRDEIHALPPTPSAFQSEASENETQSTELVLIVLK